MQKIIISVILFISMSGFSQEYENSLLWEISGNGLEKPSYIFGTIHLIPTKDYFFEEKWIEKFNQCETLTLEAEMNFNFFQQIGLMKKVMLPDKKTVEDYMKPTDYLRYKTFMLDSLECSSGEFNMYSRMKPFFVYSVILTKLIGTDIQMYEMNLSEMADDNKMKIIGLETVDYQMSIVDSIPIEKQIEMFIFDENTSKSSMIAEFNEMVEMYKKQDITSLHTTSSESDEIADYEESLLRNRNQKWIVDIQTIINHKPAFIAVGAAHLSGEFGVLYLLEKEGYTISPVN